MQVVAATEARSIAGKERVVRGYIGPHPMAASEWEDTPAATGPQVFFVAMSPNTQIRPHFHPVDQFQVFVGGDGRLGRDALQPSHLHYSERFATYGPVQAGDTGLEYFVFRNHIDRGAFYMPESRDQRGGRPGGHVTIDLGAARSLPATALSQYGARVDVVAVAKGEECAIEGLGVHGPEFVLVVDGDGKIGGRSMNRWSVMWADSGPATVEARATSPIMQLLRMRLPS